MKAERSLFQTADAEAEASSDARADADFRAGRLIRHGAVRAWLGSWAIGKPAPRPRVGD